MICDLREAVTALKNLAEHCENDDGLETMIRVRIMTTPRIQRWPLLLAGYDYEILYQHGSKSGNPDGLSGLLLVDTVAQAPVIDDAIVLM